MGLWFIKDTLKKLIKVSESRQARLARVGNKTRQLLDWWRESENEFSNEKDAKSKASEAAEGL